MSCNVCGDATESLDVRKGEQVCEACLHVMQHAGKENTVLLIKNRIAWEDKMSRVVLATTFGHILSKAHTQALLAYRDLLASKENL